MVTLGDQTPTSGIGWRLDLAQTSDVALGGLKVQGVLIVIFELAVTSQPFCYCIYCLIGKGKMVFQMCQRKLLGQMKPVLKACVRHIHLRKPWGPHCIKEPPKGGSGGSFGKPSVGVCAPHKSVACPTTRPTGSSLLFSWKKGSGNAIEVVS
jgi:hypothetical protein